jgi:isoleucyl-tRNA synthetase
MFRPLPQVPDHPALEQEVLSWWEERETFRRLRELNRGGPRFSFFDGPVTANKTLGVHTAWGRALKDVFQRYKALQGFDQRYQNGFDCQGLWIEVGVEKSLGLNSKREIEDYGLDKFAAKCREVVVNSAEQLTRGSKRLGQWMDWGNDYYTFSDTNIEYIWRFLQIVNEKGWLYMGHRSTEWCPRCGTSLSQHELTQSGVYQDRADPSIFVRFPLKERKGEYLVAWTTTPWTLPANVAAAVKPDAEYGRGDTGEWVAVERYPDDVFEERVSGIDMVGWPYQGPFDTLEPGAAVDHRVIPWEEVSLDEGTGIVHIAPGAGQEDFALGQEHGLPVLTPVDESGHFYPDYGWLHGLSTAEAADQIVGDLKERGLLVEAGLYEHRYPHCWRCDTPLIWRVADDWLIAVDELRPQLMQANETVEWTPDYMGKRMADWLRNMGDWNISRRRYYGLPLPFYPCSCGHLNVIGSKAELLERSTSAVREEDLPELHRPWIDNVVIACEKCGEPVSRIPEVGDVWLDAGIVPFSTLGWQNPEWKPGGYATGASAGLSGADLPDHAYWEQWFPADWVSEMREQIRLWFYSQLFMSVVLVGQAPFRSVLGYEKMLDEHGREMHGSWGNLIPAEDAFERMGADVMRWQYCQQPPDRNLLFGYGPAHEIKRRLLTLWNCVSFLVTYTSIEQWSPSYEELSTGPSKSGLRPLDRWLLARVQQFVDEASEAYDAYLTVNVIRAFDEFVDDVSTWYVRRSRRRFWEGDAAAFATLWYALVQSLRTMAPVIPFLTEHLWQNLVAGLRGAPESIFLAGWPESVDRLRDRGLLEEVATGRQVAELARSARQQAGLKLRQPLRRLVVATSDPGRRALISRQVEDLAGELRVKEVAIAESPREVAELKATAKLDLVGPRYGPNLPELRRLLSEGDFEVSNGTLRAGGFVLSRGEFALDYTPREGWAVEHSDDFVVAVDTRLDDALVLEGRVYDLIRQVQRLRVDSGLEITDRIVLTIPEAELDLLVHEEWIKGETLATEIEAGDELAVRKAE